MKRSSSLRPRTVLRALSGVAVFISSLFVTPTVSAIGDEIAVGARVFNGYTRTRLPDKSFQPETYTFAEGGRYDAPIAGDPIDQVTFLDVAREMIGPLAKQGYVQSATPADTQLLIFVFWGTTRGTEDPYGDPYSDMLQSASADIGALQRDGTLEQKWAADQRMASTVTMLQMEQDMKDKIDQRNAGILGFQTELWRAYTTFGTTAAADLLSELRSNRYFVVLKAYDFQLAWKEKRRKVLWEARFSIRERGVVFREQLPAMADFASNYFGKELNNLIRRPLPEVKIEYGRPEVIRYENR